MRVYVKRPVTGQTSIYVCLSVYTHGYALVYLA